MAGNVASVGRVQTPTLAIVFNRELEIRNFKPRDYWRVTAKFEIAQGTYEGVYQRPNFKKDENDEHDRIDRVWDKAMAEAALAACQGQPLAKVSEEKKSSSQASPRLYDLTTLQREANNRFSLSARRTLQIAQALYERHKVITYPRTDSRACRKITSPHVARRWGTSAAIWRNTARPSSKRAGFGRTNASSTTRKSPITSPSSRPAPSPAISMKWKARFTT